MELLSAYLDGELPGDVRAQLEQRLATDRALAAALDQLRHGDALLRQALPVPSIDAGLLARFGLGDSAAMGQPAPPSLDNVVPIGKAPRAANDVARRRMGWAWMSGAALAASVILAVVLVRSGSPGDALQSDAAFQVAMSDLPSRTSAPVAMGGEVSPVLSLPQRGGGYCREFVLRGSADAHGVACQQDGRWAVMALVAGDQPDADDGSIVTAGGMTSAQVDRVIAERRQGDPLSAAAEQRLIAAQWRNSAAAVE